MALFPDAKFTVFFPETGVVSGTRAEGTLEVVVPADIPRADHIHMFFRTTCFAGYGSGKNRTEVRRDIFISPLEVKLDRSKPLAAGMYSYPFAIDLPAWLPPSYSGSDCRIAHVIEVRLDVDWAIDPKAQVTPDVHLAPIDVPTKPVVTRSPPAFHDQFVVDLTLDRQCIVEGEPVTGQLALRSGQTARFDAVTVSVASVATIKMGRGEGRRGHASTARIPAEALRSGQSVPFSLRYDPNLIRPTFRNGFIDHDVQVLVEIDIPWASDPSFAVPMQMVPRGSRVFAESHDTAIVGSERLYRLAMGMAAATGFAQGRLPTLVEGRIAPINVAITDSPREGRIGVDLSFDFPDLGLGATFRPLGMLEGFRASPLLPPRLADRYLLRCEPDRTVADEALADFFHAVLEGLEGASDVRFSDHHLGVRQPLANDGGEAMTELAKWTRGRAEILAQAIARLPFAPQVAAAAPAWQATATEQNACLLPHLPALTGIVVSSRIAGGEQRAIGVEIRTNKDGTCDVQLDLRTTPLPRAARSEVERGMDIPGLRPVRAVFPKMDIAMENHLTLEGAPFPSDPRTLLSVVETFFAWLLEARNERRADAPYR